MHKLKQLATNTKQLFSSMAGDVGKFYRKNRDILGVLVNALTIAAFVIGLIALFALVWLYVRPIKTANIKVPVATDQASYYPGEDVSGIFFGDTYYQGEVRILREVFCKNYKGVIKPPADSAVGNFFSTQAKARHLEGVTVPVGNLPNDVPVGSNCVLQFTNVYQIQTPFGIRHEEYQYYTQNFAIVTKERRQQLECEASGREDCNYIIEDLPQKQSSPETAPVQPQQQSTTNNTYNYDNSTTNNRGNASTDQPTEPAPRKVEQCTVNIVGIKIGCRQVVVD